MKRITQLHPVFAVRDLDEAIRYYRDKLGFSVAWQWGQPTSRVGITLDSAEIQLEERGWARLLVRPSCTA